MDECFENVKRQVWARDAYRCQECGIPVAVRGGAKPQTHHKVPRSAGGTDDPDNLITLCQPCHSTKLGHTFMLPRTPVEDYPHYIKWFLWDLSTNLLAYAATYDPMRPPAPLTALRMLASSRKLLESVSDLAVQCENRGIGSGEMPLPESVDQERRELEGIITGLRIAWSSHHTQRALDDIIRNAERT
jgi:hypothetical protein